MAITAILTAAAIASVLSYVGAWKSRYRTDDSVVFTTPTAVALWGWTGYHTFSDPDRWVLVTIAISLAISVVYLGSFIAWAWWLFNHAKTRTERRSRVTS